ncbi:MAG: cytochrome c [Dehalococcoidia bacterium]
MPVKRGQARRGIPGPGGVPVTIWRAIVWSRGPLVGLLAILALIWVPSFFLTDESAWRFGPPFNIFFSAIAIFGGLFFLLLKTGPISEARSQARTLGGIFLVFLVTVGGLFVMAAAFPQFEIPRPGGEAEGGTPVERGKALFQNPALGCNRCHIIGDRGGNLGPNLSRIASIAATRKPGMSAEEYMRESITSPSAFVVKDYAPLMGADFVKKLSKVQINEIIAYLLTLQ